jgi:hypothetical protein
MRTRLTAAALTAAALLSLAACSSSSDDDKPAATKPAAVDTASMEAALGIPPKPTGAKRTAYLAAIKAVDPYLVTDPDKAISHGRDQCSQLNGGVKNPDHLAAERFGNDAHPLTDAQGKALNTALHATLCPKK